MRRFLTLALVILIGLSNTASIGNYGVPLLIPKPTASAPSCTMSGGTQTTSGGREIHTFTSSSSLTVVGTCTDVHILIVASGGSTSACTGGPQASFGSSGAGGVIYYGTQSPAAGAAQTLTAGSYTATVGAGVAAGGTNVDANQGNDSSLTGFTTAKGGGKGVISNENGVVGGSGSGAGGGGAPGTGGAGTAGQGNAGGNASALTNLNGGAGGGCNAAGAAGSTLGSQAGGAGCSYNISGAAVTYGKGGNSAPIISADGIAGTNPGDGSVASSCFSTTQNGAASPNGIIIVDKPV